MFLRKLHVRQLVRLRNFNISNSQDFQISVVSLHGAAHAQTGVSSRGHTGGATYRHHRGRHGHGWFEIAKYPSAPTTCRRLPEKSREFCACARFEIPIADGIVTP